MNFNLRRTYHKMSPAVRTSIWFTVCNFLQRGAAFITVPVFTRLLTKEEYGVCNVYFAWFEIFLLFTSLKIPYEGLNNGLIRYEKDKDGYTSSIMGLIMTMTLCFVGVYRMFHSWIERATGLSGLIMGLMLVQLMFNPPLMLWTNRERFEFRYRCPVIVTLISTISNPLIAIILILNTPYKTEARIVSSVMVQFFWGAILIFVLFRKGKIFYKKEYWRFALQFNLPLIFYYISQSVLNQSDRIMINYYEGSGKAAVYSVAYSAATIVLLLVSAVNGSFNPWMYKKLKVKQYQEVKRIAAILCLLMMGATIGMSALAPDLVRILATQQYSQAIWIIPPVSASVFFVFLYMMFANVEMYYGENKGILVISVVCSAANLVLNAIFIPVYGYLAAGWTTLVCYMLLSFLHYLLMKRACRKHEIKDRIFPDKLLLLMTICVFVMSVLALEMYRLKYFRYAILAVGIAVLFALRNRLLGTLNQIQKGARENEK